MEVKAVFVDSRIDRQLRLLGRTGVKDTLASALGGIAADGATGGRATGWLRLRVVYLTHPSAHSALAMYVWLLLHRDWSSCDETDEEVGRAHDGGLSV